MESFIEYFVFYWPPLLVLCGGVFLVGAFVYLHVSKKKEIIKWIAKRIFRHQLMAEKSAENLFNVLTGFIVTIGGLWIILASFYFFP